jgi:DNA repair exonuclease SbcCD nuclease subunit
MKVAAVSLLCQDERVFEAMLMAGTPCPFEGKIGSEAISQWDKYDVERPDYEEYVSKLETRSRIDAELEAIKLQKEQEELARKLAEEQAKLETLKQQEEVDNIIIETDIKTKEQRIINVHN